MLQTSPNEKWDRRFLALAEHVAQWSKDPSTQVGAVIVDPDNRVVSLGYNGFPRGVLDTPERLADRELKYRIVLHAERNAILFARRSVAGCTLCTWPFPTCAPCSAEAVQAGITRVVAPGPDFPGLPGDIHDKWARWAADIKLAKEIYAEAGVAFALL